MKSVFVFLVSITSIINFSFGQSDSLIKLNNKLHVITGLGGNVTFLTTEDGVLLVDAGSTKSDGEKINGYIRSVTDKPLKYVVYTHYHYDHIFGACGLEGKPTIIGHKNIYNNIKTYGEPYLQLNKRKVKLEVYRLKEQLDSIKKVNGKGQSELEKAIEAAQANQQLTEATIAIYPNVTFDKELTIYLGTDTIKLSHPGNSHTDCEIIVEFTNQKALATGDLFFNHLLPYIDSNANGNTANWAEQAKRLSANPNYQIVIPGHGNIATAKDLMKQANYLTDLRATIQKYIDMKKPLPEILKEMKMPGYEDYQYQEFLPIEIEAVYKELTSGK